MSRAFFDTNVLIYATLPDDRRGERARALLSGGGVLSVQVLNEFVAVARRKLQRPWGEIAQALAAVRALCEPPRPITLATHEQGLALAGRFGFGWYDSLILASALEAGCTTLWSEDFQAGQVVEGRLAIHNPFAAG